MGNRLRVCVGVGLCAAVLSVAAIAPAQPRRRAGVAYEDPDWRFEHPQRRVKVVLLAGSIGAFRGEPYGRLLHEWCSNAEIQNLSRVGQGAPQLVSRFRSEVLENPMAPVGAPGLELWVLFGGGLNSVGVPQRTNRAVRRLFTTAHRRRVGVVALTLTPWGDDGTEDERWRGANALRALDSTRVVVDFVMGRASPAEALGRFRNERRRLGVDAPWQDSERPDVAIDLYDSRLRHRDAETWPLDEVRASLARDPAWRRQVAELDEAARERRLEADARRLAQAPRWFLRPEYRGFDHIHPNRAGHRAIAEIACPALPESWDCACP